MRDSIMRRILRGEVDRLDHGTDHIVGMRARERERAERAAALRAQAAQRPEGLVAAARRRLAAMK